MCMQVNCKPVYKQNEAEARKIIRNNLKRNLELLEDAFAVCSESTKVVLFPEFFLTGLPTSESREEWLKIGCTTIPGEETDALGEKAKKFGIYIAANLYDIYEDWPEIYQNTSFIIDPDGKVVHKYRRIIAHHGYSPHDIYDDFIKKYGEKALFPVTKTPLGNFATLICGEVLLPEVARCLALNGAEVFLHSHGGGITMDSSIQICSRARAIENMAYLATASHASACINPLFFSGGSVIYDYGGRILKRAPEGAYEAYVNAPIDINSLRDLRHTSNPLSQLKVEVFAPIYQQTSIWPVNSFLKKPMKDLNDLKISLRKALENMKKAGILTSP